MPLSQIDVSETREMMLDVSQRIVDSVEILTEADRMGDGDHGTGMSRGFTEVKSQLTATETWDSVASVLKAVGMGLMMKVGGAAGAIFGTMFRSGGEAVTEKEAFDSTALAMFLEAGLEAVKKRGNVKSGDKTVVDALEPAAKAASEHRDSDLLSALSAAAAAAENGKEQTKDMAATVGKAKTLGERSIGHPDPGAVSLTIMLQTMRDYARRKGESK